MQWHLIRERKEHGETQKDLSKLLDISENAYRLKEKGDNQFKSEEMFLIADHYNKSIRDIFLPNKYTLRKHKRNEE
ncbi:helix-turn-helix transcriptional regulator [Marinilactibacillus piezotolerans]|uniref:helix-turn-helix transcriptional regulator n=1 Tax=Marinilactibacillus piezotolerans TaxID=258723 RepID=UPI0009AFC91C|nr:helix-turn-helix domain-containing protein [Marinilactibacillus piezotolerans]